MSASSSSRSSGSVRSSLRELLLVVCISVAADASSTPASSAATTHAKQAIDTIVAGIKSGDSTKTAALFEHGAVALAGAGHEVDEPDLIKTLGRLGPHDVVTDVKVSKLVVGGNEDAAWVFACLAITKRNQEPGEKPKMRRPRCTRPNC